MSIRNMQICVNSLIQTLCSTYLSVSAVICKGPAWPVFVDMCRDTIPQLVVSTDAPMATHNRITPLLRQCFVTTAVSINIIGNGCGFGFPGILLPQIQAPSSSIQLDTEQQSWIASVLSITVLVGNCTMPPIMGRLGRKIGHFVVLVPIIAAWLTITIAASFEALLIGRMLQGMSFGLLLPLRSVLIGEYTTPEYRGAFLAVISFAQGFGIFFVHLVGSMLTWKQTACVCMLFPIISLIMTFYIPESPSWLADKGKYDRCRETFKWLRGEGENQEVEELIKARIEFKESNMSRGNINIVKHLLVIIKKKKFYKPIVLMIHVSILVYVAGSTQLAAYPTRIIEEVMGPSVNANFWMVMIDSQRIVSNAITIYVIHKVRRRSMLFSTGMLCVGSHIAIIGYTYARKQEALPYDAVWIPALLLNVQMFSVATGMIPLPNIIAGEIFPLEYRSISGSISSALVTIYLFTVVKTFPNLVDNIGIHGAYAVYGSLITYGLLVIWFMLPETKGKTLQQIEDEYEETKRTPEENETLEKLQPQI